MHLAFLSSLYPPHTKGGGELSTHYIAQALQAAGHTVTVISCSTDASQYEVDGVNVITLPSSANQKPLLERRAARKVATQLAVALTSHGPFDIIHAHDFRMALALSELKLPNTVVTARDYAQICGSTNFLSSEGDACPGCNWQHVWGNHRVAEAGLVRKFFRAYQYVHNMPYRAAAFRTFPAQIFISRAQQQLIAANQDLRGVAQQVIYNPVPPAFLEPATPTNSKKILYIGTVEWYKGVDLLLQAFKQLATQQASATLTIVGEGADRARYEKLVQDWQLTSRITFTGRHPAEKIRQDYDAADIIIAPHIWVEPFGRTVIEAMARGKVVVAARLGGPTEIIQENITGFFFTPNSVEDLTKVLQAALSLPSEKKQAIGTAAREWVTNNLSPANIAKQHEEFYQILQKRNHE